MLFISDDFRSKRIQTEQCNSPKGALKWQLSVVEDRVKQRVASLCKPYGEIQGQIFMTHLQSQRLKGSLDRKRKVKKSVRFVSKLCHYVVNNKFGGKN